VAIWVGGQAPAAPITYGSATPWATCASCTVSFAAGLVRIVGPNVALTGDPCLYLSKLLRKLPFNNERPYMTARSLYQRSNAAELKPLGRVVT